MKNIVIIGMPGSGKTTVGMMLSKKLNMEFFDMDDNIVSMENKSINEMFEISEEYYKIAEKRLKYVTNSQYSIDIVQSMVNCEQIGMEE